MNNKLELATAQASWNLGENGNKWCVKKPDGEILFILNGDFDQKSAMEAIHLGRVFELKAYQSGIEYGRQLQRDMDLDELIKLRSAVEHLGEMNEQLSEQLDRHINK